MYHDLYKYSWCGTYVMLHIKGGGGDFAAVGFLRYRWKDSEKN